MKMIRFSALPKLIMVVVILAMLFSLGGGLSVKAAEPQASYIVQATSTEVANQLVQKVGGSITSELDIIHAVAANLTASQAAQLRLEKGILAVTVNGKVKSSDSDQATAQYSNPAKKDKTVPVTDYPDVVGADKVWAKGDTGAGVAVAILDTGLENIDQLDQGTNNKSGRIVAWVDLIEKNKKPTDPNGHGTHVAGIIANSQVGDDGEWNGVAPDVNLVGVRVLDDQGAGTYESVISGLQWVIQNKDRYNIRIINLSLLSTVQSPYWADPLDQAVTAAWASGLVVIVAAGNGGPGAMSISVPGNNPYAITVGAFTDNYTPSDWSDDYIAPFSAAGPTLDGFNKPDLVAPGAHMVSIIPAKSYLAKQYPDNNLNLNYFKLAGTSQATAVVSGIAALVLAKKPNLTPNQVKMRLSMTALPWVDNSDNNALYSMWQQGAGRANAYDAVFSKNSDSANQGMNISADLAGTQHYQGYAYYDKATQTFHLRDPFADWAGGYGSWSGGYGSWSGGYGSWSGGYGSWSGGYGSWSGGYGSWSGGYGSWSGGYGSWSGGYGSWSGGYGSWSGGYGSWSGSEPWAGSQLANTAFVKSYMAGVSPDASTTSATISVFLLNP